jgi:hypothetical protein
MRFGYRYSRCSSNRAGGPELHAQHGTALLSTETTEVNAYLNGAVRQIGRRIVLALLAAGALTVTGCQVDVGGQTLPSAYYMSDDVQYFPPGSEFKLQNEANALHQHELQPAQQ